MKTFNIKKIPTGVDANYTLAQHLLDANPHPNLVIGKVDLTDHNNDPNAHPIIIKDHNNSAVAHSTVINSAVGNHNLANNAHTALFNNKASVPHTHVMAAITDFSGGSGGSPGMIYDDQLDAQQPSHVVVLPPLSVESNQRRIVNIVIVDKLLTGTFTIVPSVGDTILHTEQGLISAVGIDPCKSIVLVGINYTVATGEKDADDNWITTEHNTWISLGGLGTWNTLTTRPDTSDPSTYAPLVFH